MILNHKIMGEGIPLIIVHGLFGSLDNWATLGRKFSEKRKVILVDQRNHGRSFHDIQMDYDHMAADLIAMMDYLGIEKADLLGHSMGGKTVMRIAMNHPERILKLIVADIGPDIYESHHQPILTALHAVDPSKLGSRAEAQEIMRKYISNEGVIQFLTKNLFWKEKGVMDWRMNLQVITDHMDEILDSIGTENHDGPTLFVRGGKSDYIMDDELMAIHMQFTDSNLETIEDAGHWLHAEQPDKFFSVVDQFLT